VFVDQRTMEPILSESAWEMTPPREGDVLELHCGEEQRWIVSEVDWVFEEVPREQHDEVPMRIMKIIVRPEVEGDRLGEGDPLCVCGHKRSVHAPERCLGSASTCLCRHFEMKA
jgi:hypothetical protein